MTRIVLASASPRRRELLRALVPEFDVATSDAPEEFAGSPIDDAERLAEAKAAALAGRFRGALVIGSDTIVFDGDRAYGKPEDAADAARRGTLITVRPIAGAARGGGSTWQSIQRGKAEVESDYLNGEVVLLGRLHGVPTPANELLRAEANEQARQRIVPGTLSAAHLLKRLA